MQGHFKLQIMLVSCWYVTIMYQFLNKTLVMININCSNTNCIYNQQHKNYKGGFPWNEAEHVNPGSEMVEPYEPDADYVVAICPKCKNLNGIWFKDKDNFKRSDDIFRS